MHPGEGLGLAVPGCSIPVSGNDKNLLPWTLTILGIARVVSCCACPLKLEGPLDDRILVLASIVFRVRLSRQ